MPPNGFKTKLSFAKFLEKLIERFGQDIDQQQNLRAIIDAYFEKYYVYLRIEFWLGIFGYSIPFIVQLFTGEIWLGMIMLNVCLFA